MKTPLIETNTPLTLVGGGPVGPDDLALARTLAPRLVAADGGAEAVRAAGMIPEAVIGDMDSVSAETLAALPEGVAHRIADQDSTDFDKVLRHLRAPCFIGVGFAGGRIDHQIAAMHTLAARPDRRCVLLGPEDVTFLCPPVLDLPLAPGTRVSLFPMGPVRGRSQGLEWPLDGLAFHPEERIGTSNRASGPVRIEMDAPAMLCLLPRAQLEIVVRALTAPAPSQAHGQWPARAERYRDPPQS